MTTREMGPPTRDGFGEELATLGAEDSRIVVVDADVADSTRTKEFFNRFPDRAWNVGIAESNAVSIASGLASSGKVPVVASFACFLMCNAYDQIRMGVAFPHSNVKMVGSHGGISPGEDGPSQMAVEDLALASALPGVTVIVPADAASARILTREMLRYEGPAYMRTGRPNAPIVYEREARLSLGKSVLLREGSDVTLVACGLMVAEALDAAEELAAEGVEASVIDMHTIKPLDEDAVLDAARSTKGIVVCEEHLAHGGLGAAVSSLVAARAPVRMAFVNLGDSYSTSGQPEELFEHAGITAGHIVKAALSIL